MYRSDRIEAGLYIWGSENSPIFCSCSLCMYVGMYVGMYVCMYVYM